MKLFLLENEKKTAINAQALWNISQRAGTSLPLHKGGTPPGQRGGAFYDAQVVYNSSHKKNTVFSDLIKNKSPNTNIRNLILENDLQNKQNIYDKNSTNYTYPENYCYKRDVELAQKHHRILILEQKVDNLQEKNYNLEQELDKKSSSSNNEISKN